MKFLPGILSTFAVAAAMVLPISHAAEKAEKKSKFSDWDMGKVVFGEKVSKKDVKGKVVVLEFWGVQCPPCIASLPHLAEMDAKHRSEGLVIIGAESQGHSKDQMKPVLEKAKVNYTITDGAEGPIEISSLPRVFVFGADGEQVFDGSPSGPAFEKAVADALAAVKSGAAEEKPAGNLIELREWTNATGGNIRAAVKTADDKTVTFVMANGKNVDYALEKLSEESRKAIAEAVAKTKVVP